MNLDRQKFSVGRYLRLDLVRNPNTMAHSIEATRHAWMTLPFGLHTVMPHLRLQPHAGDIAAVLNAGLGMAQLVCEQPCIR